MEKKSVLIAKKSLSAYLGEILYIEAASSEGGTQIMAQNMDPLAVLTWYKGCTPLWKPSRGFSTLPVVNICQRCQRTLFENVAQRIPGACRQWLEVGGGCELGSSGPPLCILHPVPRGELSPEARSGKRAGAGPYPPDSPSDVCPARTAARGQTDKV